MSTARTTIRTIADAIAVAQTLPRGNSGLTISLNGDTISFTATDNAGNGCAVVAAVTRSRRGPTESFTAHIAPTHLTALTGSRRSDPRALAFDDGTFRLGTNIEVPAVAAEPVTIAADHTGGHATAHIAPAAFLRALTALEPHKRAVKPRNEGHARLSITRHGAVSMAVVGDYSAASVHIPALDVDTATTDCHGHTRIGAWTEAVNLLDPTAANWTITVVPGTTRDQITVTDGVTAVTVVAPTTRTPNFDAAFAAPAGLRCWDLDIADISVIDSFLRLLPCTFNDDTAFVQIRNHLGHAEGRPHQIEFVAREGSQLAVAGEPFRNIITRPVMTTSVDEAEVDVTLSQMRQIVATAMHSGGGRITLRGYTPYESMSQLVLTGNGATAVTIGRIPQPL
ncbi:hypothetical protein [Prescottella subtropica]|uniref:hypothetical protein n=1 Tax=Prescottella subtropica TaxID=2545757 RepID=UPI0010F7C10A|nr:hypothetical protein [Prescottella subtropica]